MKARNPTAPMIAIACKPSDILVDLIFLVIYFRF